MKREAFEKTCGELAKSLLPLGKLHIGYVVVLTDEEGHVATATNLEDADHLDLLQHVASPGNLLGEVKVSP